MAGEPVWKFLFVCTGNQCRSPMAAALLGLVLQGQGPGYPTAGAPGPALPGTVLPGAGLPGARVGSAGFVSEGAWPPEGVVAVMSEVGIDVSGHRSRKLARSDVEEADLVVGMTRQHLVEMVVAFPDHWRRCFTYAELLARAEATPPLRGPLGPGAPLRGPLGPGAPLRGPLGPGRPPGEVETLAHWVARVGAARRRPDIIGLPLADDVDDPMGGTLTDYRRTRDLLTTFTYRLSAILPPA